eukprot:scaffold539_cov359-Prasinococcus_capsulatus_cf.AAC.25
MAAERQRRWSTGSPKAAMVASRSCSKSSIAAVTLRREASSTASVSLSSSLHSLPSRTAKQLLKGLYSGTVDLKSDTTDFWERCGGGSGGCTRRAG